jgi:hypothetical protein
MTLKEAGDPILDGLGRLPPVAPDAARSERVRRRCRTVLARRRSSDVVDAPPTAFAGRAVELALVTGFCLTYLAVVIRHAWQMVG